jgi:hypothetical protein
MLTKHGCIGFRNTLNPALVDDRKVVWQLDRGHKGIAVVVVGGLRMPSMVDTPMLPLNALYGGGAVGLPVRAPAEALPGVC